MKLLLHGCCADCVLKFIQALNLENTEVTVYFYNPNIHPRSEYFSRLKAMQKICEENNLKLIVANWSPKEYFQAIKTKVWGERCKDCWNLRLSKAAEYAKNNNYQFFSSTLLSSKYQSREYLKQLGKNIANEYGIEFTAPENIPQELPTKGFYKQNYCGCCYSLAERMEEKFSQAK